MDTVIDRAQIGRKLRNTRETLKLSVQEVAREAGVSESAIYMYEQGERLPRDEVKLKLAKIYKMPLDFFFKPKNSLKVVREANGRCV